MQKSLWIIPALLALLCVGIGVPNAQADAFTATFTCTQVGGCTYLPTPTTVAATFAPGGPNAIGAFTWDGAVFSFSLPTAWLPTDSFTWQGVSKPGSAAFGITDVTNQTPLKEQVSNASITNHIADSGNLVITPAQATPEPSSGGLMLLGIGLVGLVSVMLKRTAQGLPVAR
jgi:hypothetical protein